jgi:hypothetical protein
MKITDMLNEDQFAPVKDELADYQRPTSVYDMTPQQKKLVQMGQKIKASLSPRTSDVQWDDDEQWLMAMKMSDALIDAGKNDTDVTPLLKSKGVEMDQAKAIIDKVKSGNVDITKHTDGDHDGAEKLAKAVADA